MARQRTLAAQGNDFEDDLSLLTAEGPSVQHVGLASWLDALHSAPTDYRNANPNLQILSQAIDIAADPVAQKGIGRGVLLITPNLDRTTIPALQSQAARAASLNVRVSVWMVSSESFFTTQGALALRDLAIQTGGEFFGFSGEESIPSLESYIEPLRNAYRLRYLSQITTSGTQQFAIQIDSSDFQTTTDLQTFDLQVSAPNPIFVSPPDTIYRSILPGTAATGARAFTPTMQELEIIIEFPDGHEREIVRSTLYVNGEIVAENTSAPFTKFQWDVSNYKESGRHVLMAEAVDELGLSSVTMETPIEVVVQRPAEGLAATLSENGAIIAVPAVLMAAAVLILVLVFAGRMRPQPQTARGAAIRQRKEREEDPVYQSVLDAVGNGADSGETRSPKSLLTKWASQLPRKLPWPQRNVRERGAPYAFLERLINSSELEETTPTRPIPIRSSEITFGADPKQATLVLEDPSVAPLHARLRRNSGGQVYIQDQQTTAGTWINYDPIDDQESPLQDGDIIHLGKVGFRFKRNGSTERPQPKVIRTT